MRKMNKAGTKTIETPRLLLRRFKLEDAEDIFENWASDPEVTRFLTWPVHSSVDVTRGLLKDWIPRYEDGGYFNWAMEHKETGKVIGNISVVRLNENTEAADMGYCMSRVFWGQGLMPEALKAVMEYLFDVAGLNRIAACHDPNNPKSGRVMDKAGMKLEGILRAAGKNNLGICDEVWHAMLRSDRDTNAELHIELQDTKYVFVRKELPEKKNRSSVFYYDPAAVCGHPLSCNAGCEGLADRERKGFDMMNTKNYTIRLEKEEDYRAVENLVRESFWNVYRPGCSEHYVIHVLRDDPAFVKELDFVMEKDGELIGQNIFVKTIIEADDGRTIPVLTMGPIGITPELKRKGYGKVLLDYSLENAVELGYGAVLFEGNIGFYGKSGFDYAAKFGIRYHDLPEGADASFFLCKELIPGYLDSITGVYQTPQGYYVDDSDVEEFDRGFPPKLKQKLPGQIFG